MSSDSLKLEKHLCRCCHAEGCFKTLGVSFDAESSGVVYSDMIRDYLDINLTPVAGPLCLVTYTICEECVNRLHDCVSFKKQVLACEERFRDMYRRDLIKVQNPELAANIKLEIDIQDIPSTYVEALKVECPKQDDDFAQEESDFDYTDDIDLDEPPNQGDSTKINLKMTEDNLTKVEDLKKKEKGKGKAKVTKTTKKTVKQKKSVPTEAGEKKAKKGGKTNGTKFKLLETDFKMDGDVYICSHCNRRYLKKFSLRFHVKTKHYKIPRFACQYCKKEFMTLAPLTVHKLEEHNLDERFKCKACNGTFNTKIQLRKHINNFHMLGEKYKCEFCDYESFSFEGMYKHKFKHKTVKEYLCRFCRKPFLRKTTLDLHERIHTGDRRKVCKVCGQAFVQKASLNYHMTKYHPEVNF